MHAPWVAGSKLTAVREALRRLPLRGVDGGSKAVVFSASKGALQLLHNLLLGEFEREGVAFATGDVSQAQRCEEIARFHSNACCFALLLSVGACAEGLNLTVADHCFLLEPQSNVGKEVRSQRLPPRLSRSNRGQLRPFALILTGPGAFGSFS
jgi:SNF2 family DNA or RNA helicase